MSKKLTKPTEDFMQHLHTVVYEHGLAWSALTVMARLYDTSNQGVLLADLGCKTWGDVLGKYHDPSLFRYEHFSMQGKDRRVRRLHLSVKGMRLAKACFKHIKKR